MATDFEPHSGPGLQPRGTLMDRVRRILLEPKLEWPRIDAEPMTVRGIMTGWVVPLAAIGPVASLVGGQVFDYGFRLPIVSAVLFAALQYGMALLSVWVVSLIIDALAPTFEGTKNPVAAMKVAAFSYTASWVGGVFGLVPMLSVLGLLLALYSFYLLYLGLPRLMKAPESKAVAYTAASIVAAVVLYLVVGSIIAQIAFRAAMPMFG